MRIRLSGMTLVASLAVLSACSSGGGGSSPPPPPPPPPNVPPVASAGPNQTVDAATVVTLNGSGSNDPDGTIASYAWSQTAGTAVTLSSSTAAQPTFTAPGVATAATLTFSLTVTDNRGATSPASTVNVTVNPPAAGSLTGRIRFVRIPFYTDPSDGLNYTNPQNRPARGVTVRALPAAGGAPLATAVTDANGDYAMTVAPNVSVTIEVVAEMVRAGTPSWNFSVRDLPATLTALPNPLPATFSYSDGQAFNAGSGAHDVLIPSGFSTAAAGTVTGTRASAPFAILDTLYQGVELVRSAAPNTAFPDLVVDWGTNNVPEDGTFFSTTFLQHIVLTADISADTDEFDQHVIAHEFGHYIEYNFSRADNIGGSHGVGDKLDPRVAFGEGFGYAFGAIVLDDPETRDSFVESGLGCPGNQCSSTFNVETNPPASGGTNGNFGCWCSESSVWSILWDIYDLVPDTGDSVTLGFIPMWTVLTGDQRNTPAFTTIFSFITALKTQNNSSAAAIDTLVSAQNINSAGINAFATNENNFPTPGVPQLAALPIYTTATVGGAATVLRTVNDAGPTPTDRSGNKLGNHRFIRFMGTGNNVTITANSTSALPHDIDFIVYRSVPFDFWRSAVDPPAATEVLTMPTAAAEYLIDVYDCANGCDPSEGTPGDFDLTVTITN
jgi:K319-like protein